MNGQVKERKSKGVMLCRSKQQPSGKEIQGLVFDHPSMPKIVTISCGAQKKPSSGNPTTGHRPRKEHYPSGKKYPHGEKNTNGETYSTGHFTGQQSASGNSIPQQTTTLHYTPGQTYPRVHQTSAQCPPRSSPPALIHAPRQYSSNQVTPASPSDFHGLKRGIQVPNGRENPQPDFSPHNGMSQLHRSSHLRNGLSTSIPLPSTVTRETHVQYPQHGTASQRAQQTPIRQNSFGQRSWENNVQHRQHIEQHSQNVSQDTIELGTDDFSRDFHLKVWRESHKRAAMEWNSPERRQDLPVRRLGHNVHSQLTSNYNVHGTITRYRSLSTTASEQPSLAFQGERGQGLPVQPTNSQGSPSLSNLSPRDMRRYSTGHLHSSYNANCPTGPQSSPEVWNYRQRVRSAESADTRVSTAGGIRRLTSTADEYNPVLRNTEGQNSRMPNSHQVRIPGYNDDDSRLAAQSAKGNNLEVLNADQMPVRTFKNTSEVHNRVVRNAEGGNLKVSCADSIKKSSIFSSDSESETNIQRRKAPKKQYSPTVVVISDSDEDREILSPISNGECDQDVFTLEPRDVKPKCFAREGLSSNDSTSESDGGCTITKVKGLRHGREQSFANSVTSKKNGEESRECDNDNNKSRGGLGASYQENQEDELIRKRLGSGYRSVLCEQEFAGQLGTRRVVMSEQVFDKDKRGKKRSLEDNTKYFVAGSAQIAGSSLDFDLRKIRRVPTNEIESFLCSNTSHQSSQDKRARMNCGETPGLTTYHEDMPMLIRSHSENDDQIGRRKIQNERSKSLTTEPKSFERKNDGACRFFNTDDIKNAKRIRNSSVNGIARCKVCSDGRICAVRETEVLPETEASDVLSRDKCRNCDRVLNEYSPGNDVSLSVKKLPKVGPKPTGIVVGIKQDREVKQPLESDTACSKNRLKQIRQSEDVGLKELMKRGNRDSEKIANNSGATCVVPDEDGIIHKDEKPIRTVSDVTFENSKNHVKSTPCSRDQVHSSQQWEAYSVKLEQEQMAKNSCDKTQTDFNIKRNSWEELKRRFSDSVSRFDISERSHATQKRARSSENIFNNSHDKSYKFHDATDILSEQYKRRKLSASDIFASSNSSENLSDPETSTSEDEKQCAKFNKSDFLDWSELDKHVESVYCATQTAVTPDGCAQEPSVETLGAETPSPNEFSESEENTYEIQPSNESLHDIQPSEETPFEKTTQENRLFDANGQEKTLNDIQPSDIRASNANTQNKDSFEVRSSATRSSEIKPTSPGKEPEAAKSPENEEQLSLQEWTEILEGRIVQVKESIEEETTPWKTKNKKKVLEKLENHMAWMTGPSVDETIFVSKKMPFLQTVRKQYELMKKVKTHRQTMKSSDNAQPVAENLERSKGKAAKEVEASKQKKEAKKTVKYKAKGVKNTEGGTMMKKIRKAIVS